MKSSIFNLWNEVKIMMHLCSRAYLSEIVNQQECAKMTFHTSSALSRCTAFDILMELQSISLLFVIIIKFQSLHCCRYHRRHYGLAFVNNAIRLEFVYASNVSMTIQE